MNIALRTKLIFQTLSTNSLIRQLGSKDRSDFDRKFNLVPKSFFAN